MFFLRTVRAILVSDTDNCVTLTESADKGDAVYFLCDGVDAAVNAYESIPGWHKMAIVAVGKGMQVTKYGAVIGTAICDIEPGYHVHIHNIKSPEL